MGKYVKVLVAGPFAAGKTTFVRTVCGGRALTTEVRLTSGPERLIKPTTTACMDFGRVDLDVDGEPVRAYLFGVPGQRRLARFAIPALSRGAHALLFLVDSSSRVAAVRARIPWQACKGLAPVAVVAANKQDLPGALPPEAVARILKVPSAVPLAARDRASALSVLRGVVERALREGHYGRRPCIARWGGLGAPGEPDGLPERHYREPCAVLPSGNNYWSRLK